MHKVYMCQVYMCQYDGIPLQKHTWPRGYKIFFMLNSTEYDFFRLINVKMPTIVGILTFISEKNSILDLSEPKKAEFLDILIFIGIQNFMLN